jgi:hypothetical protein
MKTLLCSNFWGGQHIAHFIQIKSGLKIKKITLGGFGAVELTFRSDAEGKGTDPASFDPVR